MKDKKVSIIILIILGVIIIVILGILFFKGRSSNYNASSTIEGKESNIGTIGFEKMDYTCKEGETFETNIKTGGLKKPSYVASYSSSNEEVAIIDDETTLKANCTNCTRVRVTCKKAGNILLNAKSSTGAVGSANLVVKRKEGTISFSETSYTCNAGETFETMIETTDGNKVTSYRVLDENIASIDDKTTAQVSDTDSKLVRVVCKKEGNTSIEAFASNGASTKSDLSVGKSIGKIYFAANSYSCHVGESFETLITASGVTGEVVTVKTFSSSNVNVATVDTETTMVPNCSNCKLIRVICKQKGNITLNAESSTGATVSANLSVDEEIGTIRFDKGSYSCTEGETFETLITAYNTSDKKVKVVSYTTSDSKIATIDDKTSIQANCYNCRMVRVVCKKTGSVILSATSSSGAKTTSSLSVKKNVGKVYFKENSYSCKAGEKFDTIITAEGTSNQAATVKSYSSSDKTIATVAKSVTSAPKCINCVAVTVNCLKTGSVTLKAESSLGATDSVSLKVEENLGTISYSKGSYSCNAGDTFETMITAENPAGIVGIKSYTTGDKTIATVDDHVTSQVNCINCRVVRVVCLKKGNTTLIAESTSGAKTTSNLTVNEDTVGTIKFEKSSYSCTAGKTITTYISAYRYNGGATVKSYSSSDKTIATIDDKVTSQPTCAGCAGVRIVCKKKGTITLTAKSSTGAKGTATVKVK